MKTAARIDIARMKGQQVLTVEPVQATPTLERFEGTCLLLGLNPDKIRKGQQSTVAVDFDVAEVGRDLLAQCLVNAEDFDLDAFQKVAAEEFVNLMVADFFLQCMKHFERQKLAVRTTLNRPARNTSEPLLAQIRRSLELSPTLTRQTTPTSSVK